MRRQSLILLMALTSWPMAMSSTAEALPLQATATVIASTVNVRREPALDSPVLTTVPRGRVLQIDPSSQADDWVKVTVSLPDGRKTSGWIFADLVRVQPSAASPKPEARRAPVQKLTPPKPTVQAQPIKRTGVPSLVPNGLVVPGEEEQLWLQDLMRAERKRNKHRLVALGGFALIGLGAIAGDSSPCEDILTMASTGCQPTPFNVNAKKVALIGGVALAGFAGYQWHRANQTIRELKIEGNLKGFGSGSSHINPSVRWTLTLSF